jgi:hypothetical protein
VIDFLKLTGRDLHYDNPRWDDLRPGWLETRRRLWTVARRATGTVAPPSVRTPIPS